MDDLFVGCAAIFSLAIGVVVFTVTTLLRLNRLERKLGDLTQRHEEQGELVRRMHRELAALEKRFADGSATSKVADEVRSDSPPRQPEVAPPTTPLDTVVQLAPPAYFETQVAVPPPPLPTIVAPPPDLDTQVSESIPARFETKVVPSAPTEAPPPLPTHPPSMASENAAPTAPPGDLWVRMAVWLAAISCGFAAIFLVKYSIDHGWLGPAVRVVLGVIFGMGLLATGERLRSSSREVSQGLSAAGIAAFFASFFAATSLYQLIGPTTGYFLMALTTAVAVLLSLRQGYVIAAVGLVGGYLTPAMVGGGGPEPWGILLYLLLLQCGLLVVGRRQNWASLGPLTLCGGLLWVFTLLSQPPAGQSIWIGVFLLISTCGFALASGLRLPRSHASDPNGENQRETVRGLLVGAAVIGAALAMAVLVARYQYATQEWILFGLLALGGLVLAYLDDEIWVVGWIPPLVISVMLFVWLNLLETGQPEEAGRILVSLWVFGTLFTAVPYLFHLRSARSDSWAALAALIPPVYLLIALGGDENRLGLEGLHWGAVALLLALSMVVAAVPAARRRAALLEDDTARSPYQLATKALAAFAVSATTLLSLAVPLELERQWLTVAWALEVAALFWLAGRLKLALLRSLAWFLAVGVGIRLLLNPEVLSYPIGTFPVFNWLLYGYGVPIVAFAWAAFLARRQGRPRHAEAFEGLTQALLFALVFLEIRHFFYRDSGNLALLRPDAADSHLVEWGTLAICWMALGHLLRWLAPFWAALNTNQETLSAQSPEPGVALRLGPKFFLVGGGGLALFFTNIVLNPLFNAENVGAAPVFNWLLWIYGVPAVLLFLSARAFAAEREWARGFNVVALLEVFVLVTFEVRQAFHGSRLDQGSVTPAENYSYSFAWIALAFALALAAMGGRHEALRYASALIMAVAILKVFLLDSSSLDGLFRVLSFLGLGLTLFVIAYLYRRFVFVTPPDPPAPPKEVP